MNPHLWILIIYAHKQAHLNDTCINISEEKNYLCLNTTLSCLNGIASESVWSIKLLLLFNIVAFNMV